MVTSLAEAVSIRVKDSIERLKFEDSPSGKTTDSAHPVECTEHVVEIKRTDGFVRDDQNATRSDVRRIEVSLGKKTRANVNG